MRRNVSRLQRFGEICLDALVNAHPYWRERFPESRWYDMAPKQERGDFFDFRGRLSQDDFLSYSIFRVALSVLLGIYLAILPGTGILGIAFVLFWEVIWLRIYLWRLHDLGYSGKILLPILALLPLIRQGISIYQRFAILSQLARGETPTDLAGVFDLLRTPLSLGMVTFLLLLVEFAVWLFLILQKGNVGPNAYGEEPITECGEGSSPR